MRKIKRDGHFGVLAGIWIFSVHNGAQEYQLTPKKVTGQNKAQSPLARISGQSIIYKLQTKARR